MLIRREPQDRDRNLSDFAAREPTGEQHSPEEGVPSSGSHRGTRFSRPPREEGGPEEPLRSVVGARLRADADYFRTHPEQTDFLRAYVPGEFWPEPDPGTPDLPLQGVRVVFREDGGCNRIPLALIYPVMADAAEGWWQGPRGSERA